MRDTHKDYPDVQEHYKKDITYLNNFSADHMILMGDFNMPPTHPYVQKLKTQFFLYEIIEEKCIEEDKQKSTYKWGKERIDHVLCSLTLTEQIYNVQIGSYECLTSDHRPITFSILSEKNEIKSVRPRLIEQWSKKGLKLRQRAWDAANKSGIFKYFQKVKKMKEEGKKLSNRKKRHLKHKDKRLTKIILKSEKAGRVPISREWSPQIHQQWNKVKFYILWKQDYEDGNREINTDL